MEQTQDKPLVDNLRDLLELGLGFVRGIWRYRVIVLVVAWAVCAVLWLWIFTLPNRFEAQTQVYVDTENVLRPLLRGLSVDTDIMNDVSVMTRSMLSRPHLEEVARDTDLDLRAPTPIAFEGLLISLENRISIKRNRENIYSISFDDTDREVALRVVRSLLNTFVENTLGNTESDSEQAERTLRDEIDDYERRLVEAENRLRDFKRDNVGLMPGDGGDYYQRLQTAQSGAKLAEQMVLMNEQRLRILEGQLLGEEPVFGIMGTAGVTPTSVDGQISALETKLANLQVEYTDKHPEVVRTRSLLKELRVQRQQELASNPVRIDADPSTSALDLNPVYQNLRIQANTAEVELSASRADLSSKNATVTRLEKLVDVIPQVEAELNRLNRDYDIVKGRYNEMIARWENLQTSQRVRSGTDGVQFRVIEPPFALTNPVGPPRQLYALGAFLAAVAAGLTVGLALHLLHPVYTTPKEIEKLGLPVMGSFSVFPSATVADNSGINMILTAGAAALAAGAVVAFMFADPMAQIIQSVL